MIGPWLEAALADESRPERRAVALFALVNGWYRRGRIASELDAIRADLKGDTTLGRILDDTTAPPRRNETVERMKRDNRRRRHAEDDEERRRLEDWKQWRDALLADPPNAFSTESLEGTVLDLYSWLRAVNQSWSRLDVWDKEALTRAFGSDIAERAERAFRTLWRTRPPVLWSDRQVAKRNSVLGDYWRLGLAGISAEASTPGWTDSLSPDEARTATAYATIEMNGFAPFIADLAGSHPVVVSELIGGEVSAELGRWR